MAAPNTNSPGTAVATRDEKKALPPELQAKVDDARMRRQIVQTIRGQIWGKDLSDMLTGAIARYCIENNLDAVRHVEVLGGRIYLTAELYMERGAPLIRAGVVHPHEPDYINADPRLEEMAKAGDEWATAEQLRRKKLRIQYNAPEEAKAIVVQRFTLPSSGKDILGVNWCGGLKNNKRDPVGDAEPAKTAQTRALRRAWRQIADVIPEYGAQVRPLEEAAARLELPVAVVDRPAEEHRETRINRNLGGGEDPYMLGAGAPAAAPAAEEPKETVHASNRDEQAELLAEDAELLRREEE